jgi:acyl-CoA oxidase
MKHWMYLQSISTTDSDTYTTHLPDIHATSAGLKATITWWATEVFENCRRACGGHAYSAYNAIAGIIADWGVMTTGGGDNYPMAQQCARYVLFCVNQSLRKGKQGDSEADPLVGSGAYLMNAMDILKRKGVCKADASQKDAFRNLQVYKDIFEFLVVKKVWGFACAVY